MTLTDLYARTLTNMQVTAAGESPDADDLALVEEKYESVYNLLAARNLVYWAQTADVPDESVEPLVQVLSFASAQSFGRSPGDFVLGMIDADPLQQAERNLRKNKARAYVPWPQATEYF